MMKATTAGRAALAAVAAFAVSGAAIGLHAAQAQPDPQPWIHVDMTGGPGGGEGNMSLNLPLAAIEAALALAPETVVDRDGQLQLGGEHQIPVTAIRAAWTQLRDAGDIEIANIQDGRQSIRVAREGDTIVVDVTGTDEGDGAGRAGRGDDDERAEAGEREDDGERRARRRRGRDGDHDGGRRHGRDGGRSHGYGRGVVGEVQVRVPVRVVDALLSGPGDALDIRAAIAELGALRGEMVQVVHPEGRIRVWIDESPTQ